MLRKTIQALPYFQSRFVFRPLHLTTPSHMPCVGSPPMEEPCYVESNVNASAHELYALQNLQGKKNEISNQKLTSCFHLVTLLFKQVDPKKLDKNKVSQVETFISRKNKS